MIFIYKKIEKIIIIPYLYIYMSISKILTDNFDELAVSNGENRLMPFNGNYNGKQINFLFVHYCPNQNSDLRRAIERTFGCYCCGLFAAKASECSDQKGQIFLPSNVMYHAENDIHKESYQKAHKLASECVKQQISGIYVLRKGSGFLFDNLPNDNEKGFPHFYIRVSSEFHSNIDYETIRLLEEAFKRYIVQGQMGRLIQRLILQGKQSCEIFEKILQTVDYGDKFLNTLRWAMQILDDLESGSLDRMSDKDRYLFLFKHLIKQKLDNDLTSGAVSFVCQQLNQLVGLMESAKNEDGMKKLVEERLHPSNYQRPTADPTEGNVSEAMRLLGDFKITVNKISDHQNVVPVGVTKSDEFSAMQGFQALKLSAQKKEKSETFADRCGGTKQIQIKDIITCKQLVDYCRLHPESEIKFLSGGTLLYYASNTLGTNKLCYPFTWAFQNYIALNQWNIKSGSSVTHIIPGYEQLENTGFKHILFVCDGASMLATTPVNTFPEFLRSEYRRTCGTAYEALKNTMKLEIPSGEPLAFGVGTSSCDEEGRLMTKIELTIDGINCSISKI
jgi:hypothetical protein